MSPHVVFWQIKCFQQIAWGKWFDLHFCVFLSGSHSLCSVPDTDLYRKMSGQLKFLFVWFKGLKCSTGRAHWAEETHMTKIIQAVTLLSPSWRSVYLWKSHNIDHPKKVTKTCQGLVFFLLVLTVTYRWRVDPMDPGGSNLYIILPNLFLSINRAMKKTDCLGDMIYIYIYMYMGLDYPVV